MSDGDNQNFSNLVTGLSVLETNYMCTAHKRNAGENHNINTGNKSFENVAKVRVFGNNTNKSKLHSLRN
jgi:hypothetical protein